MAATALIKFTQDTNVGDDGTALLGVLAVPVHLSNVDDADVRSWQVEVVAVATSSAIPLGVLAYSDNSSTPAADFTPDTTGSYRLVLKVWDAVGRVGDPTNVDIRVFAVPEAQGFVAPPAQVWPLPLPDPRSGDATAKPNELNFGGQDQGWAGQGTGDGLLTQLVRKVDEMSAFDPSTIVSPPDPNTARDFEKLTALGFHRPVATIMFQDSLWVLEAGDSRKQARPSLTRMGLTPLRPVYSVSSPSDAEEWLNVAEDASGRLWVVGNHLRGTQRFMRIIDFSVTPPTIGDLLECGPTPPREVSEYLRTPSPAPLSFDGTRMWTVIDGSAVGVVSYGVDSSVWPSNGPWYIYADETERLAALTSFTENDVGKVAFQSDDSTYWMLEYMDPTYSWSSLPALGYEGARAARPRWVLCDTDTTHYADAQPRIWLLSSSDDNNYVGVTTVLDRFPVGGSVDATLKLIDNVPHQLTLAGSALALLLNGVNQVQRVEPDTLALLTAGLTGLGMQPISFAYDETGSSFMVLGYLASCSGSRYAAVVLPSPALTPLEIGILPDPVVVSGAEPLLINAFPSTTSATRGFLPTGIDGSSLYRLGLAGAPGDGLQFYRFTGHGLGYVPTSIDAAAPVSTLHVQPSNPLAIPLALQDGSPMRPFENLQNALDVVNQNVDTSLTSWRICLGPGNYPSMVVLAPTAKGLSGIRVSIEGVAGSLGYSTLDSLVLVPPVQGGQCSYALTNIHVNGEVICASNESGVAAIVALELRDVICPTVNAEWLLVTDTLTVYVSGSTLSTDVDEFDRYFTSDLGSIISPAAICSVYIDGAYIRTGINVLGPALLKNVLFDSAAVGVSADRMELIHTLFTATCTLTALGAGRAAPSIVMDRASYVSFTKYSVETNPSAVLLSSDGGFPGGLAAPDPNLATSFDKLSAIGAHRAVATIYFQGKPWVVNAGDYLAGERASLVRWDLGSDTPDAVVASPSDSELWLNAATDSTGRVWVVGDDQRGSVRFMRVINFTTTPPTVGPQIVCGRTPPNTASPGGAIMATAAPLAYTGTRMWTTVRGQAVSVLASTMEVSGSITPSRGPDYTFADEATRLAAESLLTETGITALQTDTGTYWESAWDDLDYFYYWEPRSSGGSGLQGVSNAQPQWIVYDGTTSNYSDGQPRLWMLSSAYERESVTPFTITNKVVLDRVLASTVDGTQVLGNTSPSHLVLGTDSIYVLAASGDFDQLLRVAVDPISLEDSVFTGYPNPIRAAYDAVNASLLVLCVTDLGQYRVEVRRASDLAAVTAAAVPGAISADALEPLLPSVLATTPSGWLPMGAASPTQVFSVDTLSASFTSHSRRGLGYVPPTGGGKGLPCLLYVDPSATGAQDGSADRPFSRLQSALDVINNNKELDRLQWVVNLAGGGYAADGSFTLAPHWTGYLGVFTEFHVHFRGSGHGITEFLDALTVTFPHVGRNCSVHFSDLIASAVVLEDDKNLRTPAEVPEHLVTFSDATVGVLSCTAITDATLQVRVNGTPVVTSLASIYGMYRNDTAKLTTVTLSGIPCHLYAEGARIVGSCQVSGGLVLKRTELGSGASLTADTLTLVDSGHGVAASSAGVFNATGAAHSIEMDNASFARVIKYGTRFNEDAQLHAIGGGEFAYEYPKVETTTDTADQVLFAQDLQYWPIGVVIGVRVVVTAYNKNTVADYGYFERNALFDCRYVTGDPTVTLVKEGAVTFSPGPVVNMTSSHAVRFLVQGTSAALLCTPTSSTTDRNNSWKAVAYFSVHKAS